LVRLRRVLVSLCLVLGALVRLRRVLVSLCLVLGALVRLVCRSGYLRLSSQSTKHKAQKSFLPIREKFA
jgi:hypothetical protein